MATKSLLAGALVLSLTGLMLTGCTAAGRAAGRDTASSTSGTTGPSSSSASTAVTVSITGGLQTVDGDNGRPIVLVAGLLGVKPEVFRRAFSGVTPANPAEGPTTEEATNATRRPCLPCWPRTASPTRNSTPPPTPTATTPPPASRGRTPTRPRR